MKFDERRRVLGFPWFLVDPSMTIVKGIHSMQRFWGKNFDRRALLKRTLQVSAGAAAFSVYTAEQRQEILAKAAAFQDRKVTIKAIQPLSATADTDDRGMAIQEVYNRFMEQYPDISVEWAYSPWPEYTQALSVAIGGGNAPDVAVWIDDQRIPSLAANGFLRTVDDLAANDGIDLTEIDPIALSSATYAGHLYGLPYYWDDRIMFHNTDYFAEAGIETAPTTWDEAVAMGAELDRKDGDSYTRVSWIPLSPSSIGGSVGGGGGNSFLFMYGWQNGGEFANADFTQVTVNDPAIVEALEWCVTVSDQYGGAEEQANFIEQASRGTPPFATGAVAMINQVSGFGVNLDANASADDPKINWAAAASPYNTTAATWSGVLSASLPVGTEHPEESWELAKFMLSPETQTYMAETLLWIPTRRSLWESIESWKGNAEIATALDAFSTTHIRPPLPNSQELWDEILRASDAALYHQASAKDALDAANTKIQAGLDKYLQGNS
jgi:ABC-type glycerol-3-phosphate transport system substrate-binding protein